MVSKRKKNIWSVSGITIALVVLGIFVASRIVPVVRGSQITLNELPKNSEVSNPLIVLAGNASDTKKLSLNGASVPLSPTGAFNQTILLHPGYNTITFDTTDTLGHIKKESYAFLLKELNTGTFAVSSLPSQN